MNYRGDFFIYNGAISPISQIENVVITNGKSIYEVVRVYNNRVAFLTEHWARMQQSASISKIQIPEIETLNDSLFCLIEKTTINYGNIEIVVNNPTDWSMRFIPHNYPTEQQYSDGVPTKTYEAYRENPNAKVKLLTLREQVGRFIESNGIYEAIYTNNNLILEGSRTNIFFIQKNIFYTPQVNAVLPGITRQIVIKLLDENNFQLVENPIQVSQLPDFDAAFLTGTSPEILPIKTIDTIYYNTKNKLLNQIANAYRDALFNTASQHKIHY